MAEGKRGFLQGIFKSIPLVGGGKKEEEGLPKEGPLPVHVPKLTSEGGKVTPYENTMGWYPHRIKYRGMFDLDDLYKSMALWFKHRRFELHENLFKSKPPEMEMRWRAERKRTSWVKEIIIVHVHMWGQYDVEAIVNGKKKKMANVRMIITINGDIESPYADIFGKPRWTDSNVQRRLHRIFWRWVMQRELGGLYWDRLYYELYDLYGLIKGKLKMGAR
ncbi:hypothetical protein HYU18_04335 [Candidatus Woesearchaeota archaeon]|nr:hypothetical protein [Candidatus Woesearchaeota archaeon]